MVVLQDVHHADHNWCSSCSLLLLLLLLLLQV
jgi:hypothetical protein